MRVTQFDDAWAPSSARADASSPSRGVAPLTIAGYTDLREIARGGDGVVFQARQPGLDRDVAIKVVSLEHPDDRARFDRELALTIRLGRAHPHIVNVLDTTTTSDGRPCLVMDFHDLGSLHDRLRAHGPLPASEVVAAGTAISDALAYAHDQGVLHRDVKPQNVLLLPTSYVLADFGIARMVDSGRTSSLDRFSYRHASPEVLDGHTPTAVDDIWSLGSTLFTVLEGRPPFAADDPAEDTALAYLRRVRLGERRPFTSTDSSVTLTALVDLILACLAPDPSNRPPSAAAVHQALRAIPTENRGWDPSGTGALAPSTPILDPDAASTPVLDPDAEPTRRRPVAIPGEASRENGGPTAPRTPGPEPAAETPALTPGVAVVTPEVPEVPAVPPGTAAVTPPGPSLATEAPSSVRARSAAGILAAAPDEAPTSLGLPAAEATPSSSGETDSGQTTRSGGTPRWRRVSAFLGGALLVGAAVGVAGALVDRNRGGDAPSPSAENTPLPTATDGPIPLSTGPVSGDEESVPQAETGNPDLAPSSVVPLDRGTSAEVSWTSPATEGTSVLVVLVVGDADPIPMDLLAPGTTTDIVDGLDPAAKDVCFYVVGVGVIDGVAQAGSSPSACLSR